MKNLFITANFYRWFQSMKKMYAESELAALAKVCREKAGKSKAEVARELNVSEPSLFNAEESPALSLTKLRIRIIETYSPSKIVGPVYLLERK
jgi:DNA-binding XRE family transcriptional regulator